VQRRACYLALGVTVDGDRDVLGMWFQETEGAKFWLQVLTELKQRGVRDVLICCVDGLKGFPDAIEAVFPETWVQTCIVHLIRHSLRYVPRRERERVARDRNRSTPRPTPTPPRRRCTRSTSAGASASRSSRRPG
jgi:putative transposase